MFGQTNETDRLVEASAIGVVVSGIRTAEPTECRSGEVLQGRLKPHECPAFGTACTPRSPLGAPMVSSEGACAAYFQFRGAGAGGVA